VRGGRGTPLRPALLTAATAAARDLPPLHAGIYIDKKCPFTGNVSIRGRILSGGFPWAAARGGVWRGGGAARRLQMEQRGLVQRQALVVAAERSRTRGSSGGSSGCGSGGSSGGNGEGSSGEKMCSVGCCCGGSSCGGRGGGSSCGGSGGACCSAGSSSSGGSSSYNAAPAEPCAGQLAAAPVGASLRRPQRQENCSPDSSSNAEQKRQGAAVGQACRNWRLPGHGCPSPCVWWLRDSMRMWCLSTAPPAATPAAPAAAAPAPAAACSGPAAARVRAHRARRTHPARVRPARRVSPVCVPGPPLFPPKRCGQVHQDEPHHCHPPGLPPLHQEVRQVCLRGDSSREGF
jgi:hypothetical protein